MSTTSIIYPGEVLIGIWVKGHDPLDSTIKFLTRGDGTHAGFRRGNGKIVENFYPRVHERDLNPGEQVDWFRIKGATTADFAKLEKWFDDQLKNPVAYSILDLFRYAVNLPPVEGGSCFCSMFVLRGCRLCLPPQCQPLVRLEYKDFAAPTQLYTSPILIK